MNTIAIYKRGSQSYDVEGNTKPYGYLDLPDNFYVGRFGVREKELLNRDNGLPYRIWHELVDRRSRGKVRQRWMVQTFLLDENRWDTYYVNYHYEK